MLQDKDIHIGMIVSHHKFGTGEIVGMPDEGEHLQIDFQSKPGHLMTRRMAIRALNQVLEDWTQIPEDGLEASLLENRGAVSLWIDEAPLRLVAAALVDMDNKARATPLKDKLTASVIEPARWNQWWKKVRPTLMKSKYFRYNGKTEIRLIAKPSDIHSVRLNELTIPPPVISAGKSSPKKTTTPAMRLAEWVIWIHSDEAGDMPKLSPPDTLRPILRQLPLTLVPTAIERLALGIEQNILASNRPATSSSRAWLNSLASVLQRWLELPDPPPIPLSRLVNLTTRVLGVLDQGEYKNLVNWMTDYTSQNRDNTSKMADALRSTSVEASDETERLLTLIHTRLDEPTVIDLWHQFLNPNPRQISGSIERRWLKMLHPVEKAEVISSLLTSVQNEDSVQAIGDLLKIEWGTPSVRERQRGLSLTRAREHKYLFRSIMLAWLLHEQLRPSAETILKEEMLSNLSSPASEDSLMAKWKSMAQYLSQNEIEQIRSDMTHELDIARDRQKKAESELDRAKRQARYFQGELQNASRVAVLDITRDALLMLGEILQQLVASPHSPSQKIEDANAGVTLVIGSLGAEPFGNVGEVTSFNSKLHTTGQPTSENEPVEIIAPGLKFTRGMDSPLVMIRAQVRVKDGE